MELDKNRKESGGKNWILKNEKRVFQSCYPVVLRSPKAVLDDNYCWWNWRHGFLLLVLRGIKMARPYPQLLLAKRCVSEESWS